MIVRAVFSLPLHAGPGMPPTGDRVEITLNRKTVQARMPRGVVQFERTKFLEALMQNSWSRHLEFHEDVPEQVRTWDFFRALKQHGVFGRPAANTSNRKEAA